MTPRIEEPPQVRIDVTVHPEPDGYWAEVATIPGCVSQGDTLEELANDIRGAIEGCRPDLADVVYFCSR